MDPGHLPNGLFGQARKESNSEAVPALGADTSPNRVGQGEGLGLGYPWCGSGPAPSKSG